ncbi:hypothetical protein QR98_0084440 [Sarcoptes scabiei]|uniref:Uncharacterized protein n=1 Tax=Sarcoptes scabiei TaxID=52283 RepID=A0A132AFY6_SARSC|nr:hypothetical protein QR98_0084440 [Sarcoptes scabiei]
MDRDLIENSYTADSDFVVQFDVSSLQFCGIVLSDITRIFCMSEAKTVISMYSIMKRVKWKIPTLVMNR